jgi:hypothetical protein
VSPPQDTLSTSTCWTVGSLLIGSLYLAHAAIFGTYIADDAGISLAYARNVVAGHGPVLYPGAEAVEAYSNPLWTFLLAGAAALGLDGADGVPLLKTLSLLFGLATLVVAARAPSIIYPEDAGPAWLAPVLLASLVPFVFWTASGMENALFAFLMLITVARQLLELRDGHARPWSALTAAGVALTRPEGIAFAAAFLLHRVLFRDRPRRILAWSLIVCGIYALFLGSRVILFGEWVPNTYYAKVDLYDRHLTSLVDYIRNADDRGTQYALASASAVWPLLALAGVGLADWRQRRTGLLIGGILAGTALYVIFVGGDFWPVGRFFTGTLPLVALAAQHALNRLTPRDGLAALLLAAVMAGVTLNRSLPVSADLAVLHAGNALISLQGRLETARRLKGLTAALGIPDPLVADPDIGGLAVAGLRVLDLGGLADARIARFHYDPSVFRAYIFEERRPDVIRTHSTWTRSTGVTRFPEFEAQYAPIFASRDAYGLHGEFVRREHLAAQAARLTKGN